VTGADEEFDVSSSHSGFLGATIEACNFCAEQNKGDAMEMWVASNDVSPTFDAVATQTYPLAMPKASSAAATPSFVSQMQG
jgi:hypothetical protein